jgi:hypothetical protein
MKTKYKYKCVTNMLEANPEDIRHIDGRDVVKISSYIEDTSKVSVQTSKGVVICHNDGTVDGKQVFIFGGTEEFRPRFVEDLGSVRAEEILHVDGTEAIRVESTPTSMNPYKVYFVGTSVGYTQEGRFVDGGPQRLIYKEKELHFVDDLSTVKAEDIYHVSGQDVAEIIDDGMSVFSWGIKFQSGRVEYYTKEGLTSLPGRPQFVHKNKSKDLQERPDFVNDLGSVKPEEIAHIDGREISKIEPDPMSTQDPFRVRFKNQTGWAGYTRDGRFAIDGGQRLIFKKVEAAPQEKEGPQGRFVMSQIDDGSRWEIKELKGTSVVHIEAFSSLTGLDEHLASVLVHALNENKIKVF